MPNALKQFGAKGTGSLSGQFHSARVRLTLIYVAILAVILLISSLVIYSLFSDRLQRRFSRRPARIEFSVHLDQPEEVLFRTLPTPQQVQEDLIWILVLVNGLLLAGAGLLSYWLAGLTLEPIQEAYETQRRFLSDASHELRTPLAILRTDLENELGEKTIKKKERDQAGSHLEEVERMTQLVNDLLLISRLDGDHSLANHKTETDLSALISLIIERLRGYAKKRRITLSAFLVKESISVKINPEQVVQALTNLLKNAIDYNKPNGKVTVVLERTDDTAVIDLTDTGVGISLSDQAKLFDRFYRADKSRSRKSGGSGLGLSIAKAIIEGEGGSISLDSQVGTGTHVTVVLPLRTESFTISS